LFSARPERPLFDRLAIIIKHWKTAIGVAMLVIAGMMYQDVHDGAALRAQARIQIDEEHTTAQTDFKEPSLVYTDPEPYYQTQYKILQGRDLACAPVKRLQLRNGARVQRQRREAAGADAGDHDIKRRSSGCFRGEQRCRPSCGAPHNENSRRTHSSVACRSFRFAAAGSWMCTSCPLIRSSPLVRLTYSPRST
jgi:hypothetical protein